MRYFALATDYDGTLATQGVVEDGVLQVLADLKASGRRPFMVTGRELPEILQIFPQAELFDRIVAENGALLCNPATRAEKTLGEPPPGEFQNLQMFLQIADGVDDDTWMFHLRKEDYSDWFRHRIKDPDLAAAVREIEHAEDLSPEESRKRVREKIEERYTAEG